MKVRFKSAIKHVLNVGAQLAAINGGETYGSVLIEFRDSLPEDMAEMVQQEATRMSAGLTSLESALGRLDGLTGDELETEVALIKAKTSNTSNTNDSQDEVTNEKSPEANNDTSE